MGRNDQMYQLHLYAFSLFVGNYELFLHRSVVCVTVLDLWSLHHLNFVLDL
jgi:hypothetical protein